MPGRMLWTTRAFFLYPRAMDQGLMARWNYGYGWILWIDVLGFLVDTTFDATMVGSVGRDRDRDRGCTLSFQVLERKSKSRGTRSIASGDAFPLLHFNLIKDNLI